MTMSFRMTGFADLDRRLKLLSKDVATKIGQSANRAGAAHLAKKIGAAAPVGPDAEGSTRTRKLKGGAQRAEKHAKISKNVKVKKTRAVNATTVENTITTTKAYHAHMVEFGSIHNAPNPFFGPAFEQETQAALDKVRDVLAKRLAKAGV